MNNSVRRAQVEKELGISEFKYLPISAKELIERYPDNWFRKLNLLFYRSWTEIYEAIQSHSDIEIDINPFDSEGHLIIISGFHEVNGKRYMPY